MLGMVFSRRTVFRMNRGRIPEGPSGPPPFATITAPSSANEGDDPAISATSGDAGLSLTLVDVSPVVDVNIQTGVTTPYATTYPDITPGSRQVRFFNEANPSEFTSTATITVTAEDPTLTVPTNGASYTEGDLITMSAVGTVDGFDANTTKVEFYLDGGLVLTVNSPTAGVWTDDWDSTGGPTGTGLPLLARRYWVGLAGETGTVDSAAITIDVASAAVAPVLTSAAIDSAGTSLVLTYDQALDTGSVPALGDYALAGTVLSVLTGTPNVTGSTVVLTLSPAVASTETGITISYTAGASPVQNAAGLDAANLSSQAVTNGSSHAYDPRDEGGAVLWTDMSDSSSYTESAGVITARTNKISSTAMSVVATPGYQATGLNGLPTADFLPSYFLTTESAVATVGANSNPHTYICVSALDIIDRNEALGGWGNSGVSTNGTRVYGQGTALSGRMRANYTNDAAAVITISGTTQTDTNAHVYSWVCSGTTIESWIDNVSDIASAAFDPVNLTPNRFAIGSRPDLSPDSSFDGQSSEEWVFNKALSSAARTRVYNYLKTKWGTP